VNLGRSLEQFANLSLWQCRPSEPHLVACQPEYFGKEQRSIQAVAMAIV